MTCRKRPATLAQLEDQEEGNKSPPKHTRDGSGGSGSSGSSGNSLAHICLCQPDPKIPRPRNGKLHLSITQQRKPAVDLETTNTFPYVNSCLIFFI